MHTSSLLCKYKLHVSDSKMEWGGVILNIDLQLNIDRLQNRLKDKPLGMPVRDSPDQANEGGKKLV